MYDSSIMQTEVAVLIVGIACAMCGKTQNKEASTNGGSIVQGQRFSAKWGNTMEGSKSLASTKPNQTPGQVLVHNGFYDGLVTLP